MPTDIDPVVLVGRRADGGRRDILWRFARGWWERELGWPVSEGHYEEDGQFCLSVAMNRARAGAGEGWNVAVITGADALPEDARQVIVAAELALARSMLVFAHDHYYSLSEEGTLLVLDGEPLHGRLAEWPAWPNTYSTLFAVPRTLWDEVGGWDERFVGWGYEDFGFWSACWAFAGGFDRVSGPVFHLAHPRVTEERDGQPGYEANKDLGERYMAARSSREAALEIMQEPGGPLSRMEP